MADTVGASHVTHLSRRLRLSELWKPSAPLGFALTNPNFPTLAAGALLPVKPNSFMIMGWPDNAVPPLHPNGVPNFLPLQPWPPWAGWPGEDTSEEDAGPGVTSALLPTQKPPAPQGFASDKESSRHK